MHKNGDDILVLQNFQQVASEELFEDKCSIMYFLKICCISYLYGLSSFQKDFPQSLNYSCPIPRGVLSVRFASVN